MCDKYLHNLILRSGHGSVLVIEWLECNYIGINQDKWHWLISEHTYESVWTNLGSWKIWESND